jgi:hypothetical protein
VSSDVENPDYIAFAKRIIGAAGRRVGDGDIDSLPYLSALRDDVARAEIRAVTDLHACGYSWTEIADRMGMTRQSCHERFARHCQAPPDTKSDGLRAVS